MSVNRSARRVLACALDVMVLVVLSVASTNRLQAQTDTGRIAGTVTDLTGAVIPSATITVVNQDNGQQFTATSNDSGEFNIAAVPRGNYLAKTEATGFQTQSVTFTMNVTAVQTLQFKLQPGQVSTTVTVSGAAPLVDASNATIGAVIQGEQVTELPLNGRNFANLALLTPGVTQGAYGDNSSGVNGNAETFRNNESGGAALSVNGLRPQADNYILDGVDNNDALENTIVIFPSIDATQEFKVDTSVAPAQYGRAGGAIVVSSLKSGGNDYHGSAFEFYRSGVFDANPDYRFLGAAATPNPDFNRNQYGGSIGGPILKNKLFAFGDSETYREAVPQNPSFVTVPTALMRTGDFSELLLPANISQVAEPQCLALRGITSTEWNAINDGHIYDPQTCTPVPNNDIAAAGIGMNPAAVNYLNAYPLPNVPNRQFQNYQTRQQQTTNYNNWDARLDWNATAKDSAFFRFSYSNDTFSKNSEFPDLPAGFATGSSYNHSRSYDLGYTRIVNASIVNEFHAGYNRTNYGYAPPFFGIPVSANLGIVNANRSLDTSGGALIGGNGSELEYTGDYGLYAVPQNIYELTDTVDWQRGNHSFKFGTTLIRRNLNFFNPIAGKGFFGLGNGDFTGFDQSELLIGFTDFYQIGAQNGFYGTNGYEEGFFAQDDWRFNRKLTLNLGVRYDILTWPVEEHNRQSAFNITTGQVMLAGLNGIPRSIRNNNWANFAPRIGFAYDLHGDGKTAVRGGYGIYYFPDYGGIYNQLGEQPPFGGSVSYLASNGYCVTFTGQTTAPGTPFSCNVPTSGALVTNPLPAPGFPNFNPASPPLGLSVEAVDRTSQNSMIQEYNVQLDQQFTSKDVVDLSYVGTHSEHLSTYYAYNLYQFGTGIQNYPNLGSLNYNRYSGVSMYNGLQIHYEHRASKSLLVTGSYAWSHTLDNSPGAFQSSSAALYYSPFTDYGNSAQDQRHIFSSSIVWYLPFGRGQKIAGNVSRPMDWLVGGWQINVIGLVSSGQPFDTSVGLYNPGNRPDQVLPINYGKSISHTWFDTAGFSRAALSTVTAPNGTIVWNRLGDTHRNQLYGAGQRHGDISAQKNLHFTERYTLELHGDAFNITNTPQFTNPDGVLNDTNFGKVTGTEQYSQRQIQLAARLTF